MTGNHVLTKLLGTSCLGIGLVIVLFLSSEKQIHRNNAFTRRFPPHPLLKIHEFDLGSNSYYFAGFHQNNLYLGNSTAPLWLLKINLATKDTTLLKIDLEERDLPFRQIKTKLFPPYFFLMDGTVPCIFKGRINEWKARPWSMKSAYFDEAFPMYQDCIFIRTIQAGSGTTTLGKIRKDTIRPVTLAPDILEKQVDGVFDVDGIFTYSPEHDFASYVYYYRNEFIILDSNLRVLERRRTLDTIQKAQIQVAETRQEGISEMQAPPMIVNENAALEGNLIYISSNRIGKYEDGKILAQATIIDIYDWEEGRYRSSFYFYKDKDEYIREFKVKGNTLYTLVGNRLTVHSFRNHILKDLGSYTMEPKEKSIGR